jgi:hypothetical protein
MLNHLDAAVVGGATWSWAVASGLLAEEEGLCFGGAMLLAVLPNPKNFDHLGKALAKAPPARVQAVEEALRHARPAGLLERLTAWLNHQDIAVQAMAISLLGELRLGEPSLLYRFVDSPEFLLVRRAVQALRRRRDVYSVNEIERLVPHKDPLVTFEAALAALCLGSQSVADKCRAIFRRGPAANIPTPAPPLSKIPFLLSLCGQYWDRELIQQSAPVPTRASPELPGPLGILGYPDAVDYLLAALRTEDDGLKVAAADALDLITGAGLREEVLLPDPDEPDLQVEVTRVCTSPQRWSNWWSVHGADFKLGSRYRLGKPFELKICVQELSDPQTPFDRRQRAFWELQVHSGHDIPYEPDWFVVRQRRAIQQWQAVMQRT